MFRYRIRKGKFAGIHYIYTEEEAKKKKIKYHEDWTECDIGEWGLTDDGYVTQLLHRYMMVNRGRQITWGYRFPFITIPVTYNIVVTDLEKIPNDYFTESGRVKKTAIIWDIVMNNIKIDGVEIVVKPYGRLEWGLRSYNRTNMSRGNGTYPKRLSGRAKLFIELLRAGLDPITAYMRSYNYFLPRFEYIKYRVYKLLENPAVIQHIVETGAMNDFIKKLEEAGITDEYLIREIKKTIEDNKVSSQVRASMIALILRVKGIIPDKKTSVELPSVETPKLQAVNPDDIERKFKRIIEISRDEYEEMDSEGN